MYIPNSTWTWAFTLVSVVQAVIALSLESYIFGSFQESLTKEGRRTPQAKTVPTYLSVFMFGYIYQLVLVYDALRLKNTIQVIGLCFYNLGILIYAAIQVDQIHDAIVVPLPGGANGGKNAPPLLQGGIDVHFWDHIKPYLVALPCLMALGTILLSVIAWKLYDEFAWTIYKHISADLRLKRRYLTYQIYIALLKFDFFFFLGFTVQFLVIVSNTADVEFWLTIVAIPITIILLVLAGYWTRRENILGMIFIIVIYFGALAYFLFKLIRMYSNTARALDYLPARKNLTSFAVLTILLLLVTITVAMLCTYNFNKGLKPHLTKRNNIPDNPDKLGYNSEMPALGPVPSRMTID